MGPTRRTFIQLSATAAAALALPKGAEGETFSPEAPAGETLRTRPIPLDKVRLTGGPLKQAQDADSQYLLELEPDRLLAYYRIRAGLQPKAKGYAGWDGDGRNLTGHYGGHYLSAVSLMYRATGDARMKQRADYIVRELKEVQDKNGDGDLVAVVGLREAFEKLSHGEINSKTFELNGQWSPWYTLHKTYAGLRDAYRHTGNHTALEVEKKYAAWAERLLAPLSDAQIQQMLNTEFGGMNEVLADLYHDTGDARWLALSYKFEHHAFVDPLERHQDVLGGHHVNLSIPKLIGSAARYTYTGDPRDIIAASFFFDRAAQHHTYAAGGQGLNEYYGTPDVLGTRVDGRTCESCNVYNMLKLARTLFSLRPDAYYADYHERALFNHALASFDPETRRMCYMVPVGRGVVHEYQDMFDDFTCCMGTGMENHALHGDGIYYESGDTLWVNLFAPSTMDWQAAGVTLTQQTDFPEGEKASLALTLRSPRAFTLAVRRPWWAGAGFNVRVNGEPQTLPPVDPKSDTSSYVQLKRTWRTGDVVELQLPKSLHLEPTPDLPHVTAILWGPLVLAANLGEQQDRVAADKPRPTAPYSAIPVLLASDREPSNWVKRAGESFRAENGRVLAQPASSMSVELVPFYRLHRRLYSVYFDLFTPAEWETRGPGYATEIENQRKANQRR